MAQVLLDVWMSLDGFLAAPDATSNEPLDGRDRRLFDLLHDRFGEPDLEVLDEMQRSIGAVIMDQRSFEAFDLGERELVWPSDVPCFVLTDRVPERVATQRPFTFVTDGFDSAFRQANEAAGDRFVTGHSAEVVEEFMRAGAVDEVQFHLVPILLGGGVRPFEGVQRLEDVGIEMLQLEQTRVAESPAATHIRFRVRNRDQEPYSSQA